MEKFELKLFKPGASEFKRKEHFIEICYKLINFLNDKEISKQGFNKLSKKNLNGSIIYNKYIEYKILKKPELKTNWSDRLTSLFIRQGLIYKDKYDNNKLKPMPILKLIESLKGNQYLSPFTTYDLILSLFSSIKIKGNNESYLSRALLILKNENELNLIDFNKKFMFLNLEEDLKKINKLIVKEDLLSIFNLIKSGSGTNNKNINLNIENFLKEFSNILISQDNLFNKIIDLYNYCNNKFLKDWYKWIIKSLFFSLKKARKKIIVNSNLFNELKILPSSKDTSYFRSELLINFLFFKKESSYSYLIKMYITKLPFFILKENLISIDPNMKKISNYFISLSFKNDYFNDSIENIYEKYIPQEYRKNILNKNEFFNQLDINLLKNFILNNKIWIDKNIYEIKIIREKINQDITHYNLPTWYEFFSILLIYKLSDMPQNYIDFSIHVNTKLNSHFMPITHASGGVPDAIFTFKNKRIIIEPTLVINDSQAKHEFNIVKHARSNNADICYLIAPKISNSTFDRAFEVNTTYRKNIKNIKLIPIDSNFINKVHSKNFISLSNYIENKIINEEF